VHCLNQGEELSYSIQRDGTKGSPGTELVPTWTELVPPWTESVPPWTERVHSWTKVVPPWIELVLAMGWTKLVPPMVKESNFHHTQTRTDRDEHVRINFENIMEGHEDNFAKQSNSDVSQFGLPYDFASVMHYGDYFFSKNMKRTIETLDPSKQDIIGRASGVSKGDIMLVKRMYNCNDDTSPSTATPPTTGTTTGTTAGLIDQVEGDYVQTSPPASNERHYVRISKK